jgi:hypothetical protein
MTDIETFSFNKSGLEKIGSLRYGKNWPVVYLIENNRDIYVGETTSAYSRSKQHMSDEKKRIFKKIHIVSDEEYNKSATLDIESSLIEYLVADGIYKVQNSNKELQNHNYFDREKYQTKFELLWSDLRKREIAKKDLLQLKNSDIFKYSPYKTLTDEQFMIAEELLNEVKKNNMHTSLIHGGPGTGKTILAIYLIKRLVEEGNNNVALVIAMDSLRSTLKKVFKSIPDLKANMVISPSQATKMKYDVLVVDEAHRLRQRVNLMNYKTFDKINIKLELGKEGTELDWILKSSRKTILFYDEKQTIRPSDVSSVDIKELKTKDYILMSQLRVRGGGNYLDFIENLLEIRQIEQFPDFSKYDFKIYSDLEKLVADIKKKNDKHKLSRIVAGYGWKWRSRNDKNIPDIVIDQTKLIWNSVSRDWLNSKNAINEVGCIHTIQGYDLNYAGVIIGPEIKYDKRKRQIVIDKDKYFDANGKRSISDDKELKRYIINIYKTLLTRGIMGTYVYVVDPNLREYFEANI